MKTLSNYPKRIFIGKNDNENIYLTAPSWDCGWYWGFGYLGNKNRHSHVDGLTKEHNSNMFDSFKKEFGNTLIVRDSQLWTLCELFGTFYSLKQASEILGRGGSNYTKNPCKDIIINNDEVERINNIVLPQIFEEIYKILIPAQENQKQNKELVKLNNKGNTLKVIEFMHEYKITTDDLKVVEGITTHDFNIIHSMYWELYHANKNK